MNKKSLFGREVGALAVILLVFVCWTNAHGSSFLLRVDTSNPSAVTITATGEFPEVADSSTTTLDGVTLLGFFTSEENIVGGSLSSSTLQPAGASVSYALWIEDNYSGAVVDLNLYEDAVGDQQIFVLSAPAFSGTATLNLSGYSLPGSGKTGSVLAGYSGGSGAIIGEYEVVPEPHAFPLAAGMGLIAFIWARRRFSH